MTDPVTAILNRVSWMEWDEQVALLQGLCEYMSEGAAADVIGKMMKARRRSKDDARKALRTSALGEHRAERLEAYLSSGQMAVPEWLDRRSSDFIASLGVVQSRKGFSESIGEIGVQDASSFFCFCSRKNLRRRSPSTSSSTST